MDILEGKCHFTIYKWWEHETCRIHDLKQNTICHTSIDTLTWKKNVDLACLRVRREEQEKAFMCLSWSQLVMVMMTIKIVQVKTKLKSAKQEWTTLLYGSTRQKNDNVLCLIRLAVCSVKCDDANCFGLPTCICWTF